MFIVPHILAPLIIKPRTLHEFGKRGVVRISCEAILTHPRRLRGFEETRGGHEDVDGFRGASPLALGAMRPGATM
jgi:hypothetical protein